MTTTTLALAMAALSQSAPAWEPPPATEGDVTEAHVQGMTILVKKVPNAEMVAQQLYIRGGARNWGKDDAGVEQLALRVASQGGTQSLDKIAFQMKLASLGSFLFPGTDEDSSVLMAKGPLASTDETFALLVDAFLHPAMPAAEIELQRQQQLAEIKHMDEDPDGHLGEMVNAVIWKGGAYANRPEGTLATVQKLTPEQLTAHLAKLRETSRLLLVVVGDVDPAHVIDAATAAFSKVPRGNYTRKVLRKPKFTAPSLTVEERKLPTNYIQGEFVGPAKGTAEYAALKALQGYLHEQLFEEVRTKRNLSYAPGIHFGADETATTGGIYVTAVDPNATLPVMIDVLKKVQTDPISDTDLASTKSQTRTKMLMGRETTDGQATALADGWLTVGDWRNERKLLDAIQAVSAKDMQAVAKKYFGNMQVIMLGDPKKLDEKIAKSF